MPVSQFIRDCKGGVAPLLGLALVPMTLAIGAAIDYSRASSVRAAMQAAGDATALMLARSPSILSGNQLEQKAADFFLANFHRPEATNVQVAATYAQGTSGFGVTVEWIGLGQDQLHEPCGILADSANHDRQRELE